MTDGRKRPAHFPAVERHNTSTIVFVTVCTKDRKPLLIRKEILPLLQDAWRNADAWLIGRFVIMPDHLHLFCSPAEFPGRPLDVWVKHWKSSVSQRWPYPNEKPIWQKNYWDRQLRRHGEHYSERWEYVRQNPIRAGLANDPENWPWQGEMNILPW